MQRLVAHIAALGLAAAVAWGCGGSDGPTGPGDDPGSAGFDVELRFVDDFTDAREETIRAAMAPWEEALGDLPEYTVPELGTCFTRDETVDDLLVAVRKEAIDGAGGLVATAGPCVIRTDGGAASLPASGVVVFDRADLEEGIPRLGDVATHEVGHVLGLGLDQVEGWRARSDDGLDPHFVGETAVEVFEDELAGHLYLGEGVPLAVEGGEETVAKHWREPNFGGEIMTPVFDDTVNRVSRVTLAALSDMGYPVDLSEADEFELPMPQTTLAPAETATTLSRPAASGRNYGGRAGSPAHRSIVAGANVDGRWDDSLPESELFTGLVRFDLPARPEGVRIAEAMLLTTPRDVASAAPEPEGREVEVVPVTEAWAQRKVTWDDRPALADGPVATFVQIPDEPATPSSPGLTDLAGAWIRGETPNHGLALRVPDADADPAFSVGYWTREEAPDRISAPWLVVRTDAGGGARSARRPAPAPDPALRLGDDVREGTLYGVDHRGVVVRRVEVP